VDKSYVYLDVTNTYMEMDFSREGTLPQKGVSKDHKTEPIIQIAGERWPRKLPAML